jgi:hypothetical protein
MNLRIDVADVIVTATTRRSGLGLGGYLVNFGFADATKREKELPAQSRKRELPSLFDFE